MTGRCGVSKASSHHPQSCLSVTHVLCLQAPEATEGQLLLAEKPTGTAGRLLPVSSLTASTTFLEEAIYGIQNSKGLQRKM